MSKTMTHEEIISDLKEKFAKDKHYIIEGFESDYETVNDSGWDADGKYQHQHIIVTPIGASIRNLVRITLCRCGSYFTDYDYLENHYEAVEAYEALTTYYRPLK